MMNDFVKIDYPTEEEKNHSIEKIIACGVLAPQQLTVALSAMLHSIGFRHLFSGIGDCVFLSLLGAVCLWYGIFILGTGQEEIMCLLIFICAPFLYALLHLLTVWKEILSGTYEQIMVCRCCLRQLTVLRMLIFGGISIVLTVIFSAGIWRLCPDGISVIRIMSIAFAGLFLFACLALFSEQKWKAPISCLITPIIWILLGGMLLLLGERAEHILNSIPTILFGLLAAFCAILYIRSLRIYYFHSKEGALAYAFS